jgi:hypothetical protein
MITACFAHALQRCTSRIGVHFLLIFQEAILISKTRNQLQEKKSFRVHVGPPFHLCWDKPPGPVAYHSIVQT